METGNDDATKKKTLMRNSGEEKGDASALIKTLHNSYDCLALAFTSPLPLYTTASRRIPSGELRPKQRSQAITPESSKLFPTLRHKQTHTK